MSAPETNISKQKKRHRPALIAIAVAVVFGIGIFVANVFSSVEPEDGMVEDGPTMLEGNE